MSTLIKELKTEIARLSRKEIRKALVPIQRVNATQRSLIADLRRQVAALEKQLKALPKQVASADAPSKGKSAAVDSGRFWITGKGVYKLRLRLGLTQAAFAKLAEVSLPTVVKWESTKGKVAIRRKATLAKLQEIRGMKKRDLKASGKLPAGKPRKSRRKAKGEQAAS